MSYILDALRKSDQQRQLGAAPTLQMAQPAPAAGKQSAYLYYGVLAAVLLGAGMAIGWLRPWQTAQPALPASVVAAKPPEASPRQPEPARIELAPAPERATAPPPAMAPVPSPEPARAAAAATAPARARAPAPSPGPAQVKLPAPAPVKSQISASAKVEAPGKPQDAAAAVPARSAVPEPPQAAAAPAAAQNIIWLAELPLPIQQELPPMTISVHAYSARPADRMVGINNRMLREGEYVVPGLKLEQITPEGMVFGYKGFSFRRGVK